MRFIPIALAICGLWVTAARAQTQTFIINNGQIQIAEDQKLIFAANNKVMQKDYIGADALYTQAIAINGGNIEALLQRAVVRRETGNIEGMRSDAGAVVALCNQRLQGEPQNAMLYYQRGMALRLFRHFDEAEADLKRAMALDPNQQSWHSDMEAIGLERKIAASGQ